MTEVINSDQIDAIIQANRALARNLQIPGTLSIVTSAALIRGHVVLNRFRAIVADQRKNQA